MSKQIYETVACHKCKGSGKYHYRSGMIGHCYACNGYGKIKKIPQKTFKIFIDDDSGVPFPWLNVTARSEDEAIKKAQNIGKNGCYKDRLHTATARENPITYDYRPLR